GRGQGSGRGGTSTKGHNGAQSRAGYSKKEGFEGGQMPLQRRVPKFGFNNPNKITNKVVNLSTLEALSEKISVDKIDLSVITANGLACKKDRVKVLAKGEVKKALEVSAHLFSESAKAAIEKAGGKAIVIS
ncbi:MAG: 50S ribosomal protein L15, partial [Cyclobacteriaceae bacterium]